jgi:hypothetical protein
MLSRTFLFYIATLPFAFASAHTIEISPGSNMTLTPSEEVTVSCTGEKIEKVCKCEKPKWGGQHVFLKLYLMNHSTGEMRYVTDLQEIPVERNHSGFFYNDAAEVCQKEIAKNRSCF